MFCECYNEILWLCTRSGSMFLRFVSKFRMDIVRDLKSDLVAVEEAIEKGHQNAHLNFDNPCSPH